MAEAAREERHEALPHHVFRYVEGELFDYNRKLRRARYLRTAIDQAGSPVVHAIQRESNKVGDPTFESVARQESAPEHCRELAILEDRIAQIRCGYDQLTRDCRQLVQLKYFQGTSNQLTAQQIGMSLRTFFRYRQMVVEHYASIFQTA